MRGEICFPNATLKSFDDFLLDFEEAAKDSPQIKELKVLERYPDGLAKIIYERFAVGAMFAERDLVMNFERTANDDSLLYEFFSIEHADYPLSKDIVRIKMARRSQFTQDGDDVRLKELVNYDMGGNLPPVLMNLPYVIKAMYVAKMDGLVKGIAKTK